MKTYKISIDFILNVDGDNLPDKIPTSLFDNLIENLNISDETNDMFMDSLQEMVDGDIQSFKFMIRDE